MRPAACCSTKAASGFRREPPRPRLVPCREGVGQGSGWEIATAIEELISPGHDASNVWNYPPRRLNGFRRFAGRRKRLKAAEDANAARSEPKDLRDLIKDTSKD